MSETALTGDELKKLLKVAKKRELAFAYAPGKKPEEDIYSMDRKKPPEVVSRAVRKEMDGSKYAFGLASVKGKVISLKCMRELPGMSKKLKKFFKAQKCPLNVVILDENGATLEEDIEDLPEDGLLDDIDGEDIVEDDENTQDDVQEDASDSDSDTDAPEEDDGARRKAITALAGTLKAGITNAPKQAQKPLSERYVAAVKALQAGDLDTAEAELNKVKAVIAKLEQAGEAPSDAPPAPPPPGNPAVIKLQTAAASLEKRLDGLQDGESKTKLLGVLDRLNKQIAAEDIKEAAATAKVLGEAITKVSGQQTKEEKDKSEQSEETAPTETDIVDHTATEDGRVWSDAFANLEGQVLDLLSKGFGDTSKMRAAWSAFTGAGGQKKYADAMKFVPGITKLIAEAEAAETSEAEKDIPTNVVPFVRARLGWVKARRQLRGEMGKLQNAILAQCKGEEFDGILDDTKALFEYLDGLDDRLENALEALVIEPDGAKREALKKTARGVLNDFQAELETPFFKDVDANNGFTPVNVRGTAVAALSDVNSALAG